jgi:hypothetical protein
MACREVSTVVCPLGRGGAAACDRDNGGRSEPMDDLRSHVFITEGMMV